MCITLFAIEYAHYLVSDAVKPFCQILIGKQQCLKILNFRLYQPWESFIPTFKLLSSDQNLVTCYKQVIDSCCTGELHWYFNLHHYSSQLSLNWNVGARILVSTAWTWFMFIELEWMVGHNICVALVKIIGWMTILFLM